MIRPNRDTEAQLFSQLFVHQDMTIETLDFLMTLLNHREFVFSWKILLTTEKKIL